MKSYNEQVNKINKEKLDLLLKEFPHFCSLFFRGIDATTTSRTKLSYAYDLKIFFHFLVTEGFVLEKDLLTMPLSALEKLTALDFENYLIFLNNYQMNDKDFSNQEHAKKRKLTTVRRFYSYFFKKELISNNPVLLVDIPKLHEKPIVRLDQKEMQRLIHDVETGENLTKHQQNFHKKTKIRDTAIIILLLGTGLRVSECVGLDMEDIDFKNDGIRILRKGGDESIVYFGQEVKTALQDYFEQRKRIIANTGHTTALFLSSQNTRITVRSIERLVKKYASSAAKLKRITPHKLRSTYGSALYNETGDIYLTAEVLGHKDVNTTKKHYSQVDEQRKRMAKDIVTLRSE